MTPGEQWLRRGACSTFPRRVSATEPSTEVAILPTMLMLRCSICQTEFDPKQSPAMPFCSERCRQIDLGRWLDEGYGLPYEADESPKSLPNEPDPE